MLQISGISYRINDLLILDKLDLHIESGHYFALAGENGAGKSTLIRIVLDLIRNIESGKVVINGQDSRRVSSRRNLTYLPEKFDVKKGVSGWQYLKFVCGIYQQAVDHGVIEQLCDDMGFDALRLKDKASTYSKGMIQKLGLISCFMLNKPLMILDEPLSGLDPAARFRFKNLLQKFRSPQRTIFYSTHMLADAEEICDQFAVLHQGRIQFAGAPQDCLQHYQVETLEQAYMKCIAAASSADDQFSL